MQKIAFSGAMCSGKSTLLNRFEEYFSEREDVQIVPEQARLFFVESGIPTDCLTPEVQGQLADWVRQAEEEAQNTGADLILCDRSVLDAAAYLRFGGYSEESNALIERVQVWLPTYEKFILFDPTDIPFINDEFRYETADDRDQLHQIFVEMFKEHGIAYELLRGSQEDRFQRVLELISK